MFARIVPRLPALVLLAAVACTEADAESTERAVEGVIESFFVSIFQWFLVMFLIAVIGIVLWSLLIGGAAAAIFAGLQRARGNPDGAGPATPPADPTSIAPRHGAAPGRPRADALAVGLLVGGIAMLLASTGAVCTVASGPTGAEVTVPFPMIVVGAGLIWAATRRTRGDRPASPPPRTDDRDPASR